MSKYESKDVGTQSLVDFVRTLSSAENIRVISESDQLNMDLKKETPAVRRSVIRNMSKQK